MMMLMLQQQDSTAHTHARQDADAEAAKRQATKQGVEGAISLGSQALQAVPLYGKGAEGRAFNKAMRSNPNLQDRAAMSNPEVAGMDAGAFSIYMTENFTPEQIRAMGASTAPIIQPKDMPTINQFQQNPFAVGLPMPDFQNIIR